MSELRPKTPEEIARIQQHLLNPPPGSKAHVAQLYGVDLTLTIEQLKLTPAERAAKLENATNALDAVRGIANKRP